MSGIVGSSPSERSGTIGGVDGILLSAKTWSWQDGNLAFTDGNARVGKNFVSHYLNGTSTYVLHWYCWIGACATSTTSERRIYPKVHMHTSDPGPPGTAWNAGTRFASSLIGRVMVSATSTAACSYGHWSTQSVVPYGTEGTRWFGITANSDGNAATATIYADSNNQLTFTIREFKGNVNVHAS
jgi:hypothetical protein